MCFLMLNFIKINIHNDDSNGKNHFHIGVYKVDSIINHMYVKKHSKL